MDMNNILQGIQNNISGVEQSLDKKFGINRFDLLGLLIPFTEMNIALAVFIPWTISKYKTYSETNNINDVFTYEVSLITSLMLALVFLVKFIMAYQIMLLTTLAQLTQQ